MIEFNAEQIKRAEMLLGNIKNALPKAQSNAINRSLTSARTEIVRSVTKEYIISADTVRKNIIIKSATMANPVGVVSSKGSPIALSKFEVAREFIGNKALVKARTKKTNTLKPIKRVFVARVGSGHIGVFKRAGKPRFPINQLYGPSIPQMISSKNISKQVEEKAVKTLDKRLNHEINRILEGH